MHHIFFCYTLLNKYKNLKSALNLNLFGLAVDCIEEFGVRHSLINSSIIHSLRIFFDFN